MEYFTINSDEIEGRIDPSFYRPEFIEIERKLKEMKYLKLIDISKRSKKGIFYILAEEYVSEGVPFIRISNLKNGTVVSDNLTFITEEKNRQHKMTQFHTNDILISKTGNLAISVIPEEYKKCNISQDVIGIEVDEKYNPKYIAIFLNSNIGLKQLQRILQGQVQPHLTVEQVRKIKIPDIDNKTQNRLVEIIEKAQSLKKFRDTEALKLLYSLNDYILDELGIKLPELKDKMVYVVNSNEVNNNRCDAYYYQPKFEEVEKAIKKGKYEVKKLKEFITKIHYGASVKNEYIDEGIPLLRIVNIKENKVVLRDVVKLSESMRKELGNAFVQEGDLLISRSGTVGVVAVIPKEAEGYAFGSFMIKFCLNDKINKNYVSFWLNTRVQKLFTEREKIGAIQGNITIGTIESFKIPLPPLAIQNKIAEEVKNRMQIAEQLQKEAKEELEKAKKEVEMIILGE